MSHIAYEPLPKLEVGPPINSPCAHAHLMRALRALPLVRAASDLRAGRIGAHRADKAAGDLLLEKPPLARLFV